MPEDPVEALTARPANNGAATIPWPPVAAKDWPKARPKEPKPPPPGATIRARVRRELGAYAGTLADGTLVTWSTPEVVREIPVSDFNRWNARLWDATGTEPAAPPAPPVPKPKVKPKPPTVVMVRAKEARKAYGFTFQGITYNIGQEPVAVPPEALLAHSHALVDVAAPVVKPPKPKAVAMVTARLRPGIGAFKQTYNGAEYRFENEEAEVRIPKTALTLWKASLYDASLMEPPAKPSQATKPPASGMVRVIVRPQRLAYTAYLGDVRYDWPNKARVDLSHDIPAEDAARLIKHLEPLP